MRLAPCKNCQKREIACHKSCKEYLTWKKDYDKHMKEIKERRYIEDDIDFRVRKYRR